MKLFIFVAQEDEFNAFHRAHLLTEIIRAKHPRVEVKIVDRLKSVQENLDLVVEHRVVQSPTLVLVDHAGKVRWRRLALPSIEEVDLSFASLGV